jgi:hypothetical protein
VTRSGAIAVLLQVGCALVFAAAVATWPGALPGARAVPVAQAGDEWSDVDPIRLVQTDDGRLLPVAVFYTPGAQVRSPLDLPRLLSLLSGTLLQVHSTSEPDAGGTRVTLRVTVPSGSGTPFPTRLIVSAGPLGTLTRYCEVQGTSGQPMLAEFLLPAG